MKKRILLTFTFATLILSHPALAIIPGFYAGLGAGYGILRTPNKPLFVGTLTKNSDQRGGLSGRAFIGINFFNWIGLESGYAQYARSRYQGTNVAGATSSIRYYATAIDIVAKFYLPIWNYFNIYAIAGGARFREKIQFANAGIGTVTNYTPPNTGRTNVHKTRPIGGLGLSLDTPYRVTASIEATRILKLGSFFTNASAVPYADLFTINAAYNFG